MLNPNGTLLYIVLASPKEPITTVLNPGKYLIQLWGAQGGHGLEDGKVSAYGGKGAYVSAIVTFHKKTTISVNIGGQGGQGSEETNSQAEGGWNGGGKGGVDTRDDDAAGGGGGGTDIRLSPFEIGQRIMVAGGGSGSSFNAYGAPGGKVKPFTITGVNSATSYLETDNSGVLFQGSDGISDRSTPSSGAGGGYRGGISKEGGDNFETAYISESGTSFLPGYSGQEMLSDLLVQNNVEFDPSSLIMKGGNEEFESPIGKTEIGHQGDGALSINLIKSFETKCRTLSKQFSGIRLLLVLQTILVIF